MSLNTALKKKRGSYGAHAVGPAWQYLPTQNFVSTDAQYCWSCAAQWKFH